jgi:adenylate cyclase
VVFLLNRYFRATGQAVQSAGGRLDKFIGDGVMAIFGLDREPEIACRQALDAARRMALALDDLNEAMSGDLDQPLRIGIGLHAGPPSSARWAMTAPPRSPRSAIPSTRRAGSNR